MIFKVVQGNEIHLLNSINSYQEFIKAIKNSFKKLPQNLTISYSDSEGDLISIGNQDDFKIMTTSFNFSKPIRITISMAMEENMVTQPRLSQSTGFVEVIEDLTIPLENQEHNSIKKDENNKFSSKHKQDQKQESKKQIIQNSVFDIPSHQKISCSSCKMNPLVGIRYKCIVCHDYDLCEQCQRKINHQHALIKIKTPAHIPKVLIIPYDNDKHQQIISFRQLKRNPSKYVQIVNKFVPGLQLTEQKVKFLEESIKNSIKHMSKAQKQIYAIRKIQQFLAGFSKTQLQKQIQPLEQKFQIPLIKKDSIADELAKMFEVDYNEIIKFMGDNPTLEKTQLAEKWINQRL